MINLPERPASRHRPHSHVALLVAESLSEEMGVSFSDRPLEHVPDLGVEKFS